MKKAIYLFICGVFLTGCSENAENFAPAGFDAGNFRNLVMKALSGNSTANDTLSGFIDYSIPLPGEINNIIIDSISTGSGKTFYFTLLETPNPVYNRFAVYDSDLNCLIVDKSLNGNLSVSSVDTIDNPFISIIENFISKDTLKVERMSLYKFTDSSLTLSLRLFTKLIMPRNEYTQTVTEISEDRVKTEIISKRPSIINNKGDVFTYDDKLSAYISSEDRFNKFVIAEISKYNGKISKPQITDKESELQSVGYSADIDTIQNAGNTNPRSDFSLTLTEEWKELRDVSISGYLKNEYKGTRYLNHSIGAAISVISLAPEDSAEMYIGYLLEQSAEGIYKVRFSEKIEGPKDFVQFFEYSCNDRKYLVIVEASKYTYERYREIYENIINSFEMDC